MISSTEEPPVKRQRVSHENDQPNYTYASMTPQDNNNRIIINSCCENNSTDAQENKEFKTGSHISGQQFKNIIYGCLYNDFVKPYKKLNCGLLPDCLDEELCGRKHKDIERKEMTTFNNGTLFSILDNPLSNWLNDVATAAFSVLRPQLYFRGDVFCILFDYILNGSDENMVWDIKHVIRSHFELHPPCVEPMRQFYFKLLSQPYTNENFFCRTDLMKKGIMNHIINELDDKNDLSISQPDNTPDDCAESVVLEKSSKEQEATVNEITLDLLKERWNNFQPLLDNEYNEALEVINDVTNNEDNDCKLVKDVDTKKIHRITIALELIADLLESDFMICVSNMKHCIETDSGVRFEPIINHFMDKGLHHRVFQLYASTTDQNLWTQLTRLIAVMAESEHLFSTPPDGIWNYPTAQQRRDLFSTTFCNSICECDWDEDERLLRLQLLQPAWLRLKVAMHWINTALKVGVGSGSDLQDIVDIMHMHIISPTKLEKDIHFKVADIVIDKSEEFVKKATKRNQYGETMLHRTCKQKSTSLTVLFSLLALDGVDVNCKDNFGWTPLHEAVMGESVVKVATLLQYQPPQGKSRTDISAQNCEGSTPLHEAVLADNLEICKLLVDYGGACLLRKTDSKQDTPLQLAKKNALHEISKFFDKVIKTQEALNLSPNSVLNLSEFLVELLVVACDAFLVDNHTSDVYRAMKFETRSTIVKKAEKWIVIDQNFLLRMKNDQDQFRKLRKILNNLSENPVNISLISLWNSKIQNEVDNR